MVSRLFARHSSKSQSEPASRPSRPQLPGGTEPPWWQCKGVPGIAGMTSCPSAPSSTPSSAPGGVGVGDASPSPSRGTRPQLTSASPALPRYTVRTVRPMRVRVPSTYSTRGARGKPPCASGTYPTREAGRRGLYGGPGAYVSAQVSASCAGERGSAHDGPCSRIAVSVGLQGRRSSG